MMIERKSSLLASLGFRKMPYRLKETETDLIQHIFVNARNNKILEIFQELPTEHIIITEKIIKLGKNVLKKELNKNIFINAFRPFIFCD